MLRVLELFAGIGACSKALERLGIEHEIVDAVEIDKYAIKSFNAIHGTSFEPHYQGTIRLGGLYDKNGQKHQAGSVYDPRGVAATLSTMQGGNQEPIIVASRGRGEPPMQTLEPNRTGTTNTITSVAKDNYLAEPCGGGRNSGGLLQESTSSTLRQDLSDYSS